jgi:hypothetical protein
MRYLFNCFWLLIPILLFNVLLMRRLPKAYQPDVFWRSIPAWIGFGENALRIFVFVLPLFMPLRVSSPGQSIGFALYAAGLILYFRSWSMQVRRPQSPWSLSRWGFMAPAFTPLIWLTGIALIGDSLFVPVRYSPWVYIALSVAFLAFHNLHAWIVYSRMQTLAKSTAPPAC